ncbi:EAL domain-containing protein [Ancylobacter sp. A5.8]|uniref:EAL domain-containing protein n=1 Tax=Ancylobacter gelatini TaxID=2919920 RepID=UPI001F4D9909|nr:EAL domain-containing protein [Ancylobacter gelatini]MCJ8142580.1 EAL domain-containing protein [Ancylobacter gelatini]
MDISPDTAVFQLLQGPVGDRLLEAVLVIDGTDVALFNTAAERLWGYGRAQIVGCPAARLWRGDQPGPPAPLPDAGDGPRALLIRCADGRDVAVRASVTRLADGMVMVAVLPDEGGGADPGAHLRWLTLFVNGTVHAVALLDEARRVVHVNPAFTRMFGYTLPEMAGRLPGEVLASARAADDEHPGAARHREWGEGGGSSDLLATDRRGRDIWVRITDHPVRDMAGINRMTACVAVDITREKQIDHVRQKVLEAVASDLALRDVADFLCRRVEALVPGVAASFVRVDAERRLRVLAGPSLPEAYHAAVEGAPIGPLNGNCGTAAFLGTSVVVTDILTDPRWANFQEIGLPKDLVAGWSSPIKRRDGLVIGTFAFYYREHRGPNVWEEQIVAACLHLCAIALENDEAKQQIARLSRFDALTGLPNRPRFHEDLIEEQGGAHRPTAYMLCDIDELRHVNETFGHAAGDRVIAEAASRLRRLYRGEEQVYRFAGDSFLIVLPQCSAERASAMAEKTLKAVAGPVEIAGVSLKMAASIGISLSPLNGIDGDTLVQYAGTALAQAKATKRATYRFFSPDMDSMVRERLRLGNALRRAIADKTLTLHYQPQITISTCQLYGVEALARWTDPELGNITPGIFIPLAESLGLIEAIGEWSLREACRQMADWRAEGAGIPSVAVNLSAPHFRNPALPDFIAGLLQEYALPPECLTVEITESLMMDTNAATLDTVRGVRALGVGLSMDDFGTGFSSLSSLRSLPITELKIDRSFMLNLNQDATARALMTAVIRIGQSLGLTVVTEGVETNEQFALLASLSCHVAQGYVFSQPQPPGALAAWVANHMANHPASLAASLVAQAGNGSAGGDPARP